MTSSRRIFIVVAFLVFSRAFSDTLQPLEAGRVRLLPGSAFYDRQELHRITYLASWNCDKLLFHYRALAQLPQAEGVTCGYTGWESSFLRGHMVGHYLSASARMAAATGDPMYRERVDYLVAELAKCQGALKLDGYLAAFPTGAFDQLEGKTGDAAGIGVPYYTIHKLMAGLLDAYHYVGNKAALAIALDMANYFEKRLKSLPAERIETMFRTDVSRNPQNEFGAMGDVLARVYEITREKRHLEAAECFNRPWFVDPLAEGEDRLTGLHANTHIAQALGVARCAALTGNRKELLASENFWKFLTGAHAFVIGGNSFKEWLDAPGVETGPSLDDRKVLPATTAETCNTHNLLKLTSLLFELRPDPNYAEYFERALYNHLLASVAPDTGAVTYFTPLRGQFRTYLDGTYCCVGSGIENTGLYNEGIYFQRGEALWVNLYIPSELDWREAGLAIRQQGDITRGEPVRFTILKAGTQRCSLNFRIPRWISGPATVELNGELQALACPPSTYVTLTRPWKEGDVVTIRLPAALRLERSKDNPSMVSIFYGPLLLAGELGRVNMPNDFAERDAWIDLPAAVVPEIVAASSNPVDWLEPLQDTALAFRVRKGGPADGIVFRPFYEVHHQRYSVYWSLRSESAK